MTALRPLALSATLAASLGGCAALNQPDNRASTAPLVVEAAVDLERYMGRWYEIARYPNPFERGCTHVTADYSLRPDGDVTVVNTCRDGALDRVRETATGRAWVTDPTSNAKLRVKFAPAWVPFASGRYWIIDLDEAYTTALVGEPDGGYLWVLARTPTLPETTYAAILSVAEDRGFDTAALETVPQDGWE